MAEYDYVPNSAARELSMKASKEIAVIVPDLENPFFHGLIQGITQVADRNDYQILIFNTEEDPKKEERILDTLRGKNIAGILVTSTDAECRFGGRKLLEYNEKDIPVVLMDRNIKGGEKLSSVMADNEQGAYEAIAELIARGHRRIGIIAGTKSYSPVYERELGYRRAMKEFGLEINEDYVVYGDQMADRSYACMATLMERKDAPTAVFTCNNMMTLGALRYCVKKGIVVGRDISLIGFDDIEILGQMGFNLSVVDRSAINMGKIGTEILLRRLDREKEQHEHVVVPTRLILRGTERFPTDLGMEA